MSSQDFPDLTSKRSKENPYPVPLSAQEPQEFYEAEKGLEILIVQAKMNQNMIPSKLYQEVLNDLTRISSQSDLPHNMKLAIDQLIHQYKLAGKQEDNRYRVDIDKMQAILNVMFRS